MLPKHAHAMGGQKMAPIIRKKRVDEYYANPNYCLNCNEMIMIPDNRKPAETKVKKFCSRSCAAIFNNKKRVRVIKVKEKPPKKERADLLIYRTKGNIFETQKNWQSARSSIRSHAEATYYRSDKSKCCYLCGYDKHFEIAHIKAVSDFDDYTLISIINHIDNLIGLCPNCHWEFDNGLIKL